MKMRLVKSGEWAAKDKAFKIARPKESIKCRLEESNSCNAPLNDCVIPWRSGVAA
jgi:hypothetical protein